MSTNIAPLPELGHIEVHGHTRSQFLVRATLAAGAVYGSAAVSPFVRQAFAQGSSDVEIVNYALTLEYIESAFYAEALKKVKLSSDVKKLAQQLSEDESMHVDALTATVKKLNGTPADRPTLDFGKAFTSETTFLKLANTFEDTGVSAYNAAAPSIKDKDILGAAGSIVQIEARHASLIRLARGKDPAPLAFDKPSDMSDVLLAVKAFLK